MPEPLADNLVWMSAKLFGLSIRSQFPLSSEELYEADGQSARPVDVVISSVTQLPGAGDSAVDVLRWDPPPHHPENLVLLQRRPDGTCLFSFGGQRFGISAQFDSVEVEVGHNTDLGWVSVLLDGWVLSLVVFLRGGVVLHANAVQIDGRLVAFVGSSRQGKTTLGSALCSLGGQLFTDDVLSVTFPPDSSTVRCYRGTYGLRVRPEVETLRGERDFRVQTRSVAEELDAAAVVIPVIGEVESVWSIEQLGPSTASLAVLAHPRVFSWVDPGLRQAEFDAVTSLVTRVPVFILRMPFGGVDAEQLRRTIFSAIDSAARRA